MHAQRVLVGSFVLAEPTEFTTHYECAAWYKKVLVQPGTYPVYAYPRPSERDLGHTLYVDAEGEVTDASFQPLFGGVPIRGAEDSGKREIGQREKASITIPNYAIHDHVLAGDLKLTEGNAVASEYPGTRSVWDADAKRYRDEPCVRTFYSYVPAVGGAA